MNLDEKVGLTVFSNLVQGRKNVKVLDYGNKYSAN